MTDPLEKVTQDKDLVGKIRKFVSGFVGYFDRETRRDADKMLRETISKRFDDEWTKVSEIQRRLISEKQLELVDDLEAAAIKLRTFIDRIETASYGYAGFFDAVRVNQEELAKLYEYDLSLLEHGRRTTIAVDAVSASIGEDNLKQIIDELVSVTEEGINLFNRREEVILAD
jgi:hypothetical protein